MIRILIADDHAIVRAGLKQFIADQVDMEVAGEAATGAETISLVRTEDFDVVLLDISMPDKNGIDTLKQLKQIQPGAAGADAFGARRGAVRGEPAARRRRRLRQQGDRVDAARQAIRTVTRGRKYVSPDLAQVLADGVTGHGDAPLHASLSQREFQIFCKLAGGMPVSKIAAGAVPVGQDRQHLPVAGAREDGR